MAGVIVRGLAVVFGLLAAAAAAVAGEVVAFPGAEGFGRLARGGRGGDVYHVTNLDDAGPGSLREGVRAEPGAGPRTVVFDVSGTIELKTPLRVGRSFLTIAGQSAPGDGVCLKGRTFEIKKAEHVVVRYIRMRLGDEGKTRPAGDDGITTDDVDHLIFDHVSASWGIDGIHDLRRGGNFTLQWSIYAEALNDSLHPDGRHAMLASFRDLTGGISIHHNLLASSRERHPTLGGSPRTRPDAVADFRNNVVYNLSGATNIGNCRVNLVGNLYRPGPDATKRLPIALKAENPGAPRAYLAGNLFEGAPALTADNFAAIDFTTWAKGNYLRTTLAEVRSDAEFDCGPAAVRARPAGEVLDLVLESAGASIRRDAADARIVRGVRDRTHRLIDSQAQVGGWPALAGLPAPADADRDGMPDAWEAARGLDPRDPADRNADPDGDGYTNLEDYLNGLCPPDAGPRRAQP